MAVEGQRLMTKTQHYRKVTKPLLERKRRARMNLYLDELKDLIVDTMETQGEHVNKLEKADILEMTVTYLKSRKQQNVAVGVSSPGAEPSINIEKFRAGYTQAAYEVSKVFTTLPGLDLKFGTHLMKQLAHQLKDMRQAAPAASDRNVEHHTRVEINFTKPINGHKIHPHSRRDADQEKSQPLAMQPQSSDVWRPW